MAVAAAEQILALLPTEMIFTGTTVNFTADVNRNSAGYSLGQKHLLLLILN